MKDKIVLITGASAGIGEGCAKAFAKAGAKLILTARRAELLAEKALALKEQYGTEILTLSFDVRNFEETNAALTSIPDAWKQIDVLVNNAGLARGIEKIQEGVLQNWEEMIDTNVKGLLYVSRTILPGMTERGRGTVINIASLAGREVYPGGNVYCGTKHAVKALSKGMTLDLNGTGVRVTNIDPGLVETEFSLVRFRGDKEKAENVYKGYKPLTGDDLGEIALYCASLPEHINIQDLFVTPTAQASATILSKKL